MRLAAWILLGLVTAVLFIACANVTSLFTARGASRERELAVRSALGASRVRLARQALTESFTLSVAGGVAGCLFAVFLLRLFVAMAPEGMPFLSKARIDLRILSFALATSLAWRRLLWSSRGHPQGPRRSADWARTNVNTTSRIAALARHRTDCSELDPSLGRSASGAQFLEP